MPSPGDDRWEPDESGDQLPPDRVTESDPPGYADSQQTGGVESEVGRTDSATNGSEFRSGSDGHPGDPPTAQQRSDQQESPNEWTLLVRDVTISIIAVFLLGGYLFLLSGVWPPMVAVESGSMEPNMEINDLVFVMDSDRFQPSQAHENTGVVTAESAEGYTSFGDAGDVIVFAPQGNEERTPIIHRAMFWVEADENWFDRADDGHIGNANSCDDLGACPAPHDGFITKGDANNNYDQTGNQFDPVKSGWVIGTAEVRVPGLGWLRLQFQ